MRHRVVVYLRLYHRTIDKNNKEDRIEKDVCRFLSNLFRLLDMPLFDR